MRLLSLLLVCLTLGSLGCNDSGTSQVSGDKDAKIAVISITSDPAVDPQSVNMGLTFAKFCVDEGYDVNLFLNVKGVKLATKDFSETANYRKYEPFKKQMVALNGKGAQIHVCPVCMDDLEIAKDNVIPEAFVTSKPKLFGKLGGDTMVFTY